MFKYIVESQVERRPQPRALCIDDLNPAWFWITRISPRLSTDFLIPHSRLAPSEFHIDAAASGDFRHDTLID